MVEILLNGKKYRIEEKKLENDKVELTIDGKRVLIEVVMKTPGPDGLIQLIRINRRLFQCETTAGNSSGTVWVNGRPFKVESSPRLETGKAMKVSRVIMKGPVSIEAPMAGRIVEVRAVAGSRIDEGESLLVLEAMKMENEIAAPRAGTIKEVYVKENSLVKPGDRLVLLD